MNNYAIHFFVRSSMMKKGWRKKGVNRINYYYYYSNLWFIVPLFSPKFFLFLFIIIIRLCFLIEHFIKGPKRHYCNIFELQLKLNQEKNINILQKINYVNFSFENIIFFIKNQPASQILLQIAMSMNYESKINTRKEKLTWLTNTWFTKYTHV